MIEEKKNPISNGNDKGIEEYKVGYCKPPKETQFKKGWDGGPGRPPRPNLNEIMHRMMQEDCIDNDGKNLGKWSEVLIKMLFINAAFGGKARAVLLKEILDRILGRVPLPIEMPADGATSYSERIAALFLRLDRQCKERDKAKAEKGETDGAGATDAAGDNSGTA